MVNGAYFRPLLVMRYLLRSVEASFFSDDLTSFRDWVTSILRIHPNNPGYFVRTNEFGFFIRVDERI